MNDIENSFVKHFIVKEKQDRLIYELNSKKRQYGLCRLCHNTESLLITEKIVLSGKLFHDDIIEVTGKINIDCYIIAYNAELDRKICKFTDALELVLGNGMPAVIISEKTAVIETEQCSGTPIRYVMSR